ncbi:MAG: hypothetical protein AAFV53_42400 [Myxococcota bacterium]
MISASLSLIVSVAIPAAALCLWVLILDRGPALPAEGTWWVIKTDDGERLARVMRVVVTPNESLVGIRCVVVGGDTVSVRMVRWRRWSVIARRPDAAWVGRLEGAVKIADHKPLQRPHVGGVHR